MGRRGVLRLTRTAMQKHAIRLGFLAVVAATTGCPRTHGLGETATETEDSGGGDGTGSETSDTAPTSSGGKTSTSSPSSSGDPTETGTSATGPESESGSSETGSGPMLCEGDGTIVQWRAGGFPVIGIDAGFRFALVGTCTVSDIEIGFEDEPPESYAVHLDCMLDGFVDGQAVDGSAMQPVLEIDSSAPLALEIDDAVFLRIAGEHWGGGWNRWVIVSSSDGPGLRFEGIAAERLDPRDADSPLADEIDQLAGDGWTSGITWSSGPGICGGDVLCKAEPRLVEASTTEDTQTIDAGQSSLVDLPGDDPFALVAVSTAHEYPVNACDDVPLAWYDVGATAVTQ